MDDLYTIDLRRLSLDFLQQRLEEETLTPGRRVLQEQIPERFTKMKSLGIENLQDLIEILKTQKKLEHFAVQSGLPVHYLTVLRREANSFLSKPFNLDKIPVVDFNQLHQLADLGIRNTQQLFESAYAKEKRDELARQSGLPADDLLQLVQMADLSRVYGVGPVFVRLLLEAGVTSVATLAEQSSGPLLAAVLKINRQKEYTRIMPNLNDMRVCIEFARLLPHPLEV